MNSVIKKDMEELLECNVDIEKFRNSRFFITGGNGLIAKYYTYYLLYLNKYKDLNIKIYCLVRNVEKAKRNFADFIGANNLMFLEQDICDEIKIDENIDYIIHAASSASPFFIVNDPVGIIKANTIGTMNVLEFAKTKKVKNILFTSTREIYGKLNENITVINETDFGAVDTLEPRSCYPESKRAAETILKAYYNQFGIPYTIARIAHTYGPTMEINSDGRIMADLIGSVVNNKNIALSSDGTAIRSFCYVTDTVNAMTKILLEGKIGEAYNLANETEPYMVKEVANLLVETFPEKRLEVILNQESSFKNNGYVKSPIIKLSTAKLESLGWKPIISLKEGMKRTVNYFDGD